MGQSKTKLLSGRSKAYMVSEPSTSPSAERASDPPEMWMETATITSAAAATAVTLLSNAKVGTLRKPYLWGYIAKVDGATDWATTATVKIQTPEVSPVDFVTFAVAGMTGNAVLVPGSSNVTHADAYSEGSGGSVGYGLQLKGNANGTGSDFKVTAWGIIR